MLSLLANKIPMKTDILNKITIITEVMIESLQLREEIQSNLEKLNV